MNINLIFRNMTIKEKVDFNLEDAKNGAEGNEGAENIFRTVLLIDIIYWMPLPNKPE